MLFILVNYLPVQHFDSLSTKDRANTYKLMSIVMLCSGPNSNCAGMGGGMLCIYWNRFF